MSHSVPNPLRFVSEDGAVPWIPLALCAAVLALALAVRWRERARKRAPDPDRGGRGYTPADLRGPAHERAAASERPADPREAWLLSLAAPLVEHTGFVQSSWSLLPEQADDQWRRRLVGVADSYAVRDRDRWADACREIAGRIPADRGTPDLRVWDLVTLAFVHRLGVGMGHLTAAEARAATEATEAAAAPLRADYADWLAFGDAFSAAAAAVEGQRSMQLRATMRLLYAPAAPGRTSPGPSPTSSRGAGGGPRRRGRRGG